MSATSPLRRKIKAPEAEGRMAGARPGPIWRRALTHGLDRSLDADVSVSEPEIAHLRAEVAGELYGEGALALLLDGREGFGVAILDAALLTGLVEIQTMGRISARAPTTKASTGIDAALVADPLDTVMQAQETLVSGLGRVGISSGFRYATRLAERRDITRILVDSDLDRVSADVTLRKGERARTGRLHLVLPRPRPVETAAPAPSDFPDRLSAQLRTTEMCLTAELARIDSTVAELHDLAPGSVLPISADALVGITLRAGDGAVLGRGRLGQTGGRKAVRLTGSPEASLPFDEAAIPGRGPLSLTHEGGGEEMAFETGEPDFGFASAFEDD